METKYTCIHKEENDRSDLNIYMYDIVQKTRFHFLKDKR